jgi:DNA-binding MarR family transcriptional regulator/predicted GH43/DUF377 family glycosyl hydrolase
LIGQAAAGPVILNEDTGGSWRYDFLDDEGIETCDNVVIANGVAGLIPIVNGTNWEKEGVAVENGGLYDLFFAKSPSVMKEGDIYKMWYGGWNGVKHNILYATSTNGKDWVKRDLPVVTTGLPGEYDDTGADIPKVIKDDGIYKMWYLGNDSVNNRIMYAFSGDGIDWIKGGDVFGETGVRPTSVLKDGNIFKMWYNYREDGKWKIYYAESSNGIEWIKQGRVLDTGDLGEPDDQHVSSAAVIKENDDTYRMWYGGHNGDDGYRIYYATSDNGIEWVKQGLAIDHGEPGEGDDNGSGSPCAIIDDDGVYKVWHSGVVDGYDMQVMYAVNSPTFAEKGCLKSVEISLDQKQTWEDLSIDKDELGSDNVIRVSVLDGISGEAIPGFDNLEDTSIDISTIDSDTHPIIRLYVTFAGDGTATPVLNELRITWQNTLSSEDITPLAVPVNNLWSGPSIVVAAAIGITLFSLGIAGSTEVGKYRLIPFISPLYTRLKREDVLDQLTRDKIYEYIMSNPGDHYNSIKQKLNLKNGTLAYHLRTLERENFIKSMRDGMYKRFFAVGTKIPGINGFSLYSIQGRIMEVLVRHPGLTQRDISKLLDASQQLVSYHLNQLIKSGHIRVERSDNTLRYYGN